MRTCRPATTWNNTHPINLNDTHVMSLDPEIEHRERTRVNDTQPVSLARREGKGGVFIKSYSRGSVRRRRRRRGGNGREIAAIVREVD